MYLLFISFFSTGDCSGVALDLNRGARAYAMGGSFYSIENDITGYYYNPATLWTLSGFSAEISYFPIAMDLKDNSILLGFSTERLVGALNLSYLDYGEFKGMDEHARNEFTFSGNNLIAGGGFAFGINESLNMGVALSYYEERLGTYSANSYLINLGITGRFDSFSWGAVFKNLGTGIRFIDSTYSIPVTLAGGIEKKLEEGVLLTGAIEFPADHLPVLKLGVEYPLQDILFLRMGLRSDKSGLISKLSYGMGVNYKNFGFDFAFSDYQDLGLTYVISVRYW